MSIVTGTGDTGFTKLMFGRNVPKTHPRVIAVGRIDSLNAAIGMARAQSGNTETKVLLLRIQHHLVALMGELSVLPTDTQRYAAEGYERMTPDKLAIMDEQIKILEAKPQAKDWAMPGNTVAGAALDMARAACRETEAPVIEVASNTGVEPIVLKYLNRLSDLLWLLAREADKA